MREYCFKKNKKCTFKVAVKRYDEPFVVYMQIV